MDLLNPNLLPPSSSPCTAAPPLIRPLCAPPRPLLPLPRACCCSPAAARCGCYSCCVPAAARRCACCCSPAATRCGCCSCRCASQPRTLPPEKKWQARRRRNMFNIFILVLSTFYVSNFNILSLQFQHFKRKYLICLIKC